MKSKCPCSTDVDYGPHSKRMSKTVFKAQVGARCIRICVNHKLFYIKANFIIVTGEEKRAFLNNSNDPNVTSG